MEELSFVTGINDILPPRVGNEGCAAEPPITAMEYFKRCVDKHGNKVCHSLGNVVKVTIQPSLHYQDKKGEWKVYTWQGKGCSAC